VTECVQACSNDAQVAYHTVRNLTCIAKGTAVVRWVQQGFGRTSSTTSRQATPRNLMGFKDGTNNPLGKQEEFDPIDLEARSGDTFAVASDAHVRLANQASHGISVLRRGYSFTDGIAPDTGYLDTGLFFLAYQRDPRRQFVPLQRALASEALNEYIQHVGSALFAIPPGVGEKGWVGETLLA
jgi:deferrochelatase/peroxidase EfeB